MSDNERPVQTMPISDFRRSFAKLVYAVSRDETRVVITMRGTPVAALISVDDLDRLLRWEREREERFSVIDRMRKAFADVPPEEIEREAERTVAEARERIRQRNAEPAARSA